MSGKVVGWAFDQGDDLSPTQLLVLIALADNANDRGKCWPSRREIIRKSRLSQATVYRALAALKDAGLFSEDEDEDGRPCFWLAVSHSEKTDSHPENADSHPENAPIYGTVREPSGTKHAGDPDADFDDWLAHYRQTTDRPRVKGSAVARSEFAARRRDGLTLEDLKLATAGAHADEYLRTHGHDVPETILRASKVTRYIELGRQLGPATDWEQAPAFSEQEQIDGRTDWDIACNGLLAQVPRSTFEVWIAPATPLGTIDGVLWVEAPPRVCDAIERRYAGALEQAAHVQLKMVRA